MPPHLKTNPQLWGECLVGALTQEEFLAELERAGFYGLEVLKKTYWKDVEGYPFFSVTVRGFKFEKTQGRASRGTRPSTSDRERCSWTRRTSSPRNEAYEICTDTAGRTCRTRRTRASSRLQLGEERRATPAAPRSGRYGLSCRRVASSRFSWPPLSRRPPPAPRSR